jgi:hypothetical protein
LYKKWHYVISVLSLVVWQKLGPPPMKIGTKLPASVVMLDEHEYSAYHSN